MRHAIGFHALAPEQSESSVFEILRASQEDKKRDAGSAVNSKIRLGKNSEAPSTALPGALLQDSAAVTRSPAAFSFRCGPARSLSRLMYH